MLKIYTNTAHCRTLCPPRAAAALVLWMFTISLLAPTSLIASTWNPTLLVNTEAFQIVHEGDSTTDAELRFGDTLNEKIYWDRTNAEFRFSDDIRIDGNITSSGGLVVNTASRIKANLQVAGTMSGYVLYASSGINSSGAVIIKTPVTTSATLGGTGALVVMQRIELGTGTYISASGAAILALDSPVQGRGASNTPHIAFGHKGSFDTNLYRQTGSRLRTDDSLWVSGTMSGSALTVYGSVTMSGTVFNTLPLGTVEGRLTLTSGTPVTTSDVTAATTIYFTPYKGDRIYLYDGTRWKLYSFSELSLALGTLTNALPYDVFIYDNAGTLTLESLAWTNGTTRATALTTLNGVLVKSGATTRRYLGTFYTTATTTTEDSAARRLLWNYYNQVMRPLMVLEPTDSWTYATGAYRQMNGSTANKVALVTGVNGQMIRVEVSALVSGAGTTYVAIGEDSITTPEANSMPMQMTPSSSNNKNGLAVMMNVPAAGYHYYAALEWGASGVTFYGDGGVPERVLSGIRGWIWGYYAK